MILNHHAHTLWDLTVFITTRTLKRKTIRLSVAVVGWENLYLHYAYNLASEICLLML